MSTLDHFQTRCNAMLSDEHDINYGNTIMSIVQIAREGCPPGPRLASFPPNSRPRPAAPGRKPHGPEFSRSTRSLPHSRSITDVFTRYTDLSRPQLIATRRLSTIMDLLPTETLYSSAPPRPAQTLPSSLLASCSELTASASWDSQVLTEPKPRWMQPNYRRCTRL